MNQVTHKIYLSTLVIITVVAFLILAFYGFNYYKTPLAERHFHPQNELLKPTGLIGHGIGIIGSFVIIVGVFGYMVRKRIRRFSRVGVLKYWLEFHIFLCTLGPILVLYHTTFKFGGLVAVSFWSMVAVVFSGVIGRFIYLQIPRSIQGRELSLNDLTEMENNFYALLKDKYNVNYSIVLEMNQALSVSNKKQYKNIFTRVIKRIQLEQELMGRIKKELKTQQLQKKDFKSVVKIFKSKIVLNRRIAWLSTMQNMLRYWHVIHLPFALIMLVIMIIHIVVAIIFGYHWIF